MDQKLQLCTFLSSNDFSCKKTLTLPNLQKHLTAFTIHSPKCLTHTKGFAGMPPAWQGNGGSVAVFFLFTLSEFVRDFLNIRPPARSGSKHKSGVFFKVCWQNNRLGNFCRGWRARDQGEDTYSIGCHWGPETGKYLRPVVLSMKDAEERLPTAVLQAHGIMMIMTCDQFDI